MINPIIPLEIISSIIDLLARNGPLSDLKTLSTVCSFFRDQCRKHLFETITLEENGDQEVGESSSLPSIAQFTALMANFPGVAPWIRYLTLIRPTDGEDDQEELPEALVKLTKLSTLEIRLQSDSWSELLSECVQVLSKHSSFQALILNDVAQFPINLLITLTHLRHLELIGVEIIEEGPLDDSLSSVCLKSLAVTAFEDFEDGENGTALELRKPNGEFFVDISGLESLMFLAIDQDSVDHVTCLLESQGVKFLRRLSIGISAFEDGEGEAFDYSSALQSWVLPNGNTLTTLEFHSRVINSQEDPYLGLCRVLDLMAPANKLTTLKVVVALPTVLDDAGVLGEQWRALCDVLNKPGWDSLRLVTLRVLIMNSSLRQEFSKLIDYFEPLSSKRFDFKLRLGSSTVDDSDSSMSRMVSQLAAVAPSISIVPFVF
ncbi:hypothetical protein BJ165DRAFT_1457886 [Panaeolus papilionaceus]|nr:hypothetical protein BJ165DRAFT_1457886 [Panaeolus papilionaceus]